MPGQRIAANYANPISIPFELMPTSDVIIIGGGVVGAASAFFISRAGFKTTLLEKREALGLLTTSASLAAFRAQFAEAENIAMMQESIAFFENVRERTGVLDAEIGMVQQGYLFCTTVEDGYARAQRRVELQRQLGLSDVELWDGDETRRHFPFLATNVTAATYRAKDGWLSPNDLTNLCARASGADILLGTEANEILVDGGAVRGVRTNRGEIHAPILVIAAGPFTKILALQVGLALPITLIRRQHAAIKEHALIAHYAPMTIDADTGAHWRPEGHGAILAMPTPEEPRAPLDEVRPDWDFPARVIDAVIRITPFWEDVARALRRDNLDVRAGQYDMTPDAKPIIGAHPGIDGLYIHAGYSGHGVMGSAAGGRVLADLMAGKLREENNPFCLQRFERTTVGVKEKMVL